MMLMDDILNLFRLRSVAFVDIFCPHFICSAGAHIFNIHNKNKTIYREHGLQETDLRLHIMFCAPPGFSKTFFLRQFLAGQMSALGGSMLNTAFEGLMTEAGWIGTLRFSSDGSEMITGAAKQHDTSIVGVEEFSAITEMMSATHSRTLDSALLTTLDWGYARKRLAAGSINYKTSVTLWAGTQPARFDLTSGLGRRFYFMYFIPRREHIDILRQKRREGKNINPQIDLLNSIHEKVEWLIQEIGEVQYINFTDELYDIFDDLNIIHYEEPLYERMAVGYNVMNRMPEKHFEIVVDPRLERLIRQEYKWRESLKYGAHQAQIIMILRDSGGTLEAKKVKEMLVNFGIDFKKSDKLIKDMLGHNLIRMDGDYLVIDGGV